MMSLNSDKSKLNGSSNGSVTILASGNNLDSLASDVEEAKEVDPVTKELNDISLKDEEAEKEKERKKKVEECRQKVITELDLYPESFVFTPVGKPGREAKAAYRAKWQSEDAISRDELKEELKKGKASGVGLRTGSVSGFLLAVDVDGTSAETKLSELSEGDIPETVSWTSGKSGRQQLLYRIPDQYKDNFESFTTHNIPCDGKDPDGKLHQIEFRYNKHQSVLPPSYHPDTGEYLWIKSPQDCEITEAPSWLIDLCLKQIAVDTKPKEKSNFTGLHDILPFDIQNYKQLLEPDNDGRANRYICPICSQNNLSINPETGKYNCWGTYESDEEHLKQIKHWILNKACEIQAPKGKKKYKKKTTDGEEKIPPIVIAKDFIKEQVGGALKYNELTMSMEMNGETVCADTIRLDVAENFGFDLPQADCIAIYLKIAKENKYHPIKDYLNDVFEKHKESLDLTFLDNLSQKFFGTSEPIYDIYLKKHLIGSVARIFRPGCKKHEVLILQSTKQGIGKSTFFSNLYGDDFFTDDMGETSDKDEKMKMHRFWCIEWAELETVFSKKEVGKVKSFITSATDSFRTPYGRIIEPHPRPSILVGTSNKDDFLADPTGDRRYWVIPVKTSKIPTNELLELRDKIWATAIALFQANEQWYLTDDEKQLSFKANEQFRNQDPWTELIQNFLLDRQKSKLRQPWIEEAKPLTPANILADVLKIETAKQGYKEETRVIDILKKLGYKRVQRRWQKGENPIRFWVKEDDDNVNTLESSVIKDSSVQTDTSNDDIIKVGDIIYDSEKDTSNDERPFYRVARISEDFSGVNTVFEDGTEKFISSPQKVTSDELSKNNITVDSFALPPVNRYVVIKPYNPVSNIRGEEIKVLVKECLKSCFTYVSLDNKQSFSTHYLGWRLLTLEEEIGLEKHEKLK